MMLASTLVTPAQFIVKNRLLHNGELRLRQLYRAVCTIPKWIGGGGAENTVLQYLGAEYAKCSCSLKNLDLGNLLIGAIHYLRACECIIFSPWSIKALMFVLSTSICMGGRLILGFFFHRNYSF